MSYPFLGPRLKIERAIDALNYLAQAEAEFFSNTTPVLVVEIDQETGDKLLKVKLNTQPPEIFHVVVGELIYHLRSSLDQIAVACARLSQNRPKDKNVEFPCGENQDSEDAAKNFDRQCTKYLVGFDSDLADQIRNTQAYDGGNDSLRAVFRMGNIDKHLNLIPAAARGNLTGVSNFTIKEAKVGLILSGPRNLNDGLVISNLGANGSFTANNPNAKIAVSGQIVLGNVSKYEGKAVIPFLAQMVDSTKKVYEDIVKHCQATGRFGTA